MLTGVLDRSKIDRKQPVAQLTSCQTIFSSNLVQTVDQHLQQSAMSLVPSPQIWLYFAIALPLMGLTLAWILYVERKSRKVILHP